MSQLDFAPARPGTTLAKARLTETIRHFRSVFSELGLEDERAFGCLKASGEISGHRVTVSLGVRSRNRYLTPDISRRVYTGLIVSIRVETSISTRLLFSNARSRAAILVRFMQRWRGQKQLTSLPRECRGYSVWCSEPEWAEAFIHDQTVRSHLGDLMHCNSEISGHTVGWGPNACSITLAQVPHAPSAETVRGWFEPLIGMVKVAEARPPRIYAARTWLERQADQGRLPLIIAGMMLGGSVFLLGCVMIAAFAAALVLGGLG